MKRKRNHPRLTVRSPFFIQFLRRHCNYVSRIYGTDGKLSSTCPSFHASSPHSSHYSWVTTLFSRAFTLSHNSFRHNPPCNHFSQLELLWAMNSYCICGHTQLIPVSLETNRWKASFLFLQEVTFRGFLRVPGVIRLVGAYVPFGITIPKNINTHSQDVSGFREGPGG